MWNCVSLADVQTLCIQIRPCAEFVLEVLTLFLYILESLSRFYLFFGISKLFSPFKAHEEIVHLW